MEKLGGRNDHKRLFTVFATLCILVLVCYGMYFNALGPSAPVMMDFFGADNTMQGFIMTIQSVGAIIIGVFLSLFGERFNKLTVAFIGAALIAVSAINISLIPSYISQGDGYSVLISFACVGGVGMSLISIMVNSILSDVYPEKRKVILPLVQGFYGVACMIIPVIVSLTVNENNPSSFSNPYLIVGIIALFTAVAFGITGKLVRPYTVYADMDNMKKRSRENPAEIYKQPMAWVLFASGFLYFFFQIGTVTWFPTFALNDLGVDYSTAAFFNTAFFAGQLVMRFLLVALLKKLSPERCFVIFGSIGIVFMVLAMFMPDPTTMIIMLVIGGFFQGGGAPLLSVMALSRFPERAASATAMMDLSINVSSLLGPVLIGIIADANGGSFWSAMFVLIAALGASCIVIGIGSKYEKKKKMTEV